MKKLVVSLLVAGSFAAVASSASAQSTVSIAGFNCSVTAYNATVGAIGVGVQAQGGVSCGGTQAGYPKKIDVILQNLVSGGWQNVGSTGWKGWSSEDPFRWGWGFSPCVFGRWYASDVIGQVQSNGVVAGAETNSHNSGWQCL